MNKLVLLILAIVISGISLGQKVTDTNIFGDVQCNGEHIPFINVFIEGTTIGTTTDATGHYNLLNLPEGKHTLKVQGIGYKPVDHQIEVEPGTSIEVKFQVEEDVFLMEQIVVTSDRNEINRKEAPVIVNVVSPKLFEQRQSNSLIDGLDFTSGVRTESNCSNCGFTQVRMIGLEGPYSQILINSRPVFSGLAGVYGLELLPSNMIERIEIVRGGGSALYGGNAIAGTINVITREAMSNTFQVGSDLSIIGVGHQEGGDVAYDMNIKFNGSIVSPNNKSGLFIYGMSRKRNAYDENNDGFSEMVNLKNNSMGFNTYYKPGKLSKISLDFYKLIETRRGGNKLDMLPHEADITEMVHHDITGMGLNFESFTPSGNKLSVYTAGQFIDRNSYYGALQDPSGYGDTKELTYNIGVQYAYNIDNLLFLPAKITTGGDYTHGNLEDTKLGYDGLSNTMVTNQFSNTSGLFLQSEWNSDKSKILIGVRFDRYNINDKIHEGEGASTGNVFIPRATFLYDFTEDFQFRLSYAKGYRAPQIFDEDLHIETSGARRVTHTNDPDLTQETSHSFTSSLNFTKAKNTVLFEFLIEGFCTLLQYPFTNEYTPVDDDGNVEYVRKNAEDGAFVAGINTEINMATMKDIKLQLGFTIQKSEYQSPQAWGSSESNSTTSFLRTPDQYGYLTFDTPLTEKLDFSATGTYTGPMLIPHFGEEVTDQNTLDALYEAGDLDAYESAVSINNAIISSDIIEGEELIKSKSFFDLGLKLRYTMKISTLYKIEFNTGVQNLFNNTQGDHDRGVYKDPGYIYGPYKPRTVYFGIKFGFI